MGKGDRDRRIVTAEVWAKRHSGFDRIGSDVAGEDDRIQSTAF